MEGALGSAVALDLARQRFERRPAERVVGTALRCGGEAGDDPALEAERGQTVTDALPDLGNDAWIAFRNCKRRARFFAPTVARYSPMAGSGFLLGGSAISFLSLGGMGRHAHRFWCSRCQAIRCRSGAPFGRTCRLCQAEFIAGSSSVAASLPNNVRGRNPRWSSALMPGASGAPVQLGSSQTEIGEHLRDEPSGGLLARGRSGELKTCGETTQPELSFWARRSIRRGL
jgi:hypothetical protein